MALSLNGSNQILYHGASLVSMPFTVSLWAYPAAQDTSLFYTCWAAYNKDATENNFELALQAFPGSNKLSLIVRSGGATLVYYNSSNQWSKDSWWHACGVYANSGDWRSYLANTKATDGTGANPGARVETAIGVTHTNGAYSSRFNGRLAEVGLWDVALTDAEVAVLSKGFSPLFIRPQSLVAYWPVIGRTSPEIDLIGNYDMTVTNSPTAAAHPPIIYPSRQDIVFPATSFQPRPGASIQGGVWMV